MSKFNILYWNIHYTAGYRGQRKAITDKYKYFLMDASTIVNYVIQDTIRKHTDNLIKPEDIDAIIFTEAYPQKDNENYNTLLKDSFEKLGFDVFQSLEICDKKKFDSDIIINKNGILIAVKSKYNFKPLKAEDRNIDYLVLSNDNFEICGLRNYKKVNENINTIMDVIKSEKQRISIGDFNYGYDNLITLNEFFKNNFKKCADGTNFEENYIDNLCVSNGADKVKIFEREFLMEEKYYDLRRPDIVQKMTPNTGIAYTPYPDHNLLFASVEV